MKVTSLPAFETTADAITFCGEAIIVAIPPQFPDHAIPKRRALLNGSDVPNDAIIGRASESVSVVDATLDSKDAVKTLMNMSTSKIVDLVDGTCDKTDFEILVVIFSFESPALKVNEPRKTSMTGSMNFDAKSVANSEAGIL